MSYDEFWRPLTTVCEAGEAKAMTQLVMETLYGLTHADLLCGRMETLPEMPLRLLQSRLMQCEPVQYVLGQAEFCGRRFRVGPGVLIPRPETEELCRWIFATLQTPPPPPPLEGRGEVIPPLSRGETIPPLSRGEATPPLSRGEAIPPFSAERDSQGKDIRILDIGTGSGCSACTLAAEIDGSRVTAWDVSETAIDTAADNARRLGVEVTVERQDALHPTLPPAPTWNIIVSNPPYICRQEREDMSRNVTDYEPEEALFVSDDDPLLFYRAIAGYAAQTLVPGGRLYFEINHLYVSPLEAMLHQAGFSTVETRKDQFGKQRFTCVCKQ